MASDQKLLWGGLGLLLLVLVCCFGIFLGSTLLKDRARPAAPATSDIPPFTPVPTATASEPTPTNMLVTEPSATPAASPTPVVVVVTATPTPVGPPPPSTAPTPTLVPPIQPTGAASDFQALAAYAEAVKPMLDEGLAAAKRDGDILKESEENPDVLCGDGLAPNPTLVADAALMQDLEDQLNGIIPPAEAADSVHKPLVESARLWGDALDNINLSCQTEGPVAQGLLRLEAVLQLGGSMLNFHIASDNFWRLVTVNGLEAIVGTPTAR